MKTNKDTQTLRDQIFKKKYRTNSEEEARAFNTLEGWANNWLNEDNENLENILDDEVLPRLFDSSEKVQERQMRKERQQEEILDNQALTKMFYRDEKAQERKARREVQEEDILDNKILPRLFEKHNSVIGKFKHAIGIVTDKIIDAYNVVKRSIGHAIGIVADRIKESYNAVKYSALIVGGITKSAFNKATNWVKSVFSKNSDMKKSLDIDGEFSLTNPIDSRAVQEKIEAEQKAVANTFRLPSYAESQLEEKERGNPPSYEKVLEEDRLIKTEAELKELKARGGSEVEPTSSNYHKLDQANPKVAEKSSSTPLSEETLPAKSQASYVAASPRVSMSNTKSTTSSSSYKTAKSTTSSVAEQRFIQKPAEPDLSALKAERTKLWVKDHANETYNPFQIIGSQSLNRLRNPEIAEKLSLIPFSNMDDTKSTISACDSAPLEVSMDGAESIISSSTYEIAGSTPTPDYEAASVKSYDDTKGKLPKLANWVNQEMPKVPRAYFKPAVEPTNVKQLIQTTNGIVQEMLSRCSQIGNATINRFDQSFNTLIGDTQNTISSSTCETVIPKPERQAAKPAQAAGVNKPPLSQFNEEVRVTSTKKQKPFNEVNATPTGRSGW